MTPTLATPTSEFAAAVRAALSDLPPDELDELTDGLEADLAERAEESGLDLGDPEAYAEELRAAAGYPPRSAKAHVGRDLGTSLRSFPADAAREWKALVARHPAVKAVVDFFVSLRPVWWVLRALVLHVMLASFVGFSGLAAWPIAVGLIILSVQLGRGRMLGRAWVRWVLRAVSAVAVIATPFVLAWGVSTWNNGQNAMYYNDYVTYDYGTALNQNGKQIDNIFAYDAEGNPVDHVQLFDQDGQPLNITSDTTQQWWDAQDGSMLVPNDDVPGRAGWNVFPLAHVNDWSDYDDDGQITDDEVSPAQFPFTTVKSLAGAQAPDPSPTDGEFAPTANG
jgi:hypothetical protein